MKTAFTVWNDRIAPLFDVAGKIHVVESEAGNITAQTKLCLDDPMPALKVRRLADLGVQMLVCGAISRASRNMVTAYGIELVAYINGDLDTVIKAWQNDQLRTDVLRMPGCNSPFHRGCVSGHPATKELKKFDRRCIMPGRDRTGPMGRGAMSGRGNGNCTGLNVSGTANPRPWRGLAMNVRGGGWSHGAAGGYGRCNPPGGTRRPVRLGAMRWNRPDDGSPDNVPIDKESLKQRMQALQSEMAAITKQMDELEAATEEEGTENDPL